MCIELGYPDTQSERALLEGLGHRDDSQPVPAEASPADLQTWQATVNAVTTTPPLLDYLQALLQASRDPALFQSGLSPRAGLGLLRAARASALLDGRTFVTPDDVRRVLPALAVHRITSRDPGSREAAVDRLLECVPAE
jgi:MoxR-like ATPase